MDIFVNGCQSCTSPMEILNQYRNLYYKELKDTERGIMAMVINDIFMKAKQLGVLDELNKQ